MDISKEFVADRVGDDPLWEHMPGFRAGEERWCAAYEVEGVLWAVGIAFASKRDAEIAIMVLHQRGIGPREYHDFPDDRLDELKREVMRNLLW